MTWRTAMPLYEFVCLKCNKTFTLPLSVSDFEKRKYQCPSCHSKKLEEKFTSVNVVTSKKS
jgi:putative FmdB family regulatory protein